MVFNTCYNTIMKIGIYDPYLNGLEGGEKYMLTIASCLSDDDNVYVFWNEGNILTRGQKKFDIDLKNVKVTPSPFGTIKNTLQRIGELNKFDTVVFLSDGSLPFIPSKKLVVHFQFPVEWVDKSLKTKIKLTRIKKIICNSQFTKLYIDRKFDVNSLVLYPPVEIKADTKIKKQNTILNVGRFGLTIEGSIYKKQNILIDQFKKMVDEGLKNWKLKFVIGSRDEFLKHVEDLEKLASGYPIEFYLNVNNKELWKIYSEAKIYWHATGFGENLEKHPEYAEHFGISTVEAMGAGAVPVVIDAGGQKEIVEEKVNGMLWATLVELREKTLKLIEEPRLLNKLSQKARKDAKKFDLKRFCAEIKNIIHS